MFIHVHDLCSMYAEFLSCSFAVIFPMDLLEKGLSASNFAMLGLGDIVIPGELKVKIRKKKRLRVFGKC